MSFFKNNNVKRKLVKPIKVLPVIIKLLKLMQKSPHITELFACVMNVFVSSDCLNLFRNVFNSKTVKINSNFIRDIQSNPMSSNICIFIKICYIYPILYFLGELSLKQTPLNQGSFNNTFVFPNLLKDGME